MLSEKLVERRRLMDAEAMSAGIGKMAEAILSECTSMESLALIGIRRGGVPVAEKLQKIISKKSGINPPIGKLDITLYRDDVFRGLEQPSVGPTDIDFRLENKFVVLVDDVLYTGRTVRAALDALMDFGRPIRIMLCVLADRGGRELPIAADIAGMKVDAGEDETVEVRFIETCGEDAVIVMGEKKNA